MSSYSSTIMQDQRIVAEGAQAVVGPDASLAFTQAYPGSVAVGAGASVGDIVFEEYTPLVAETVGKLIESVELVHTETIPTLVESFNIAQQGLVGTFGQAITESAEQSLRVTEVLGEKLQETQLGTASILPGVAKYMLIAAVVIIIAGKVWK